MDNSNRKITSKSTKNNGLTIKNAVEVITPLQGELFEIETTRTIDGIEMGVFSDGTPFLSQRGVQALCGLTTNGIISNLSKEWENFYNNDFEISKRPRLSFIKKILDENGYTSPSLYIRKKFNDNDIYAYPDTVCMAILEYYAFECENPVKVAIDRYRMLAKKSFRDFVYFNPEKYTVVASKDGFKTQTTIIDWHVSGWYWAGNFVIGGLIGYLIIDPITGDMYYLDEEVNLNMSPAK